MSSKTKKVQTNDIRDRLKSILSRYFSEEDTLEYEKQIFNLSLRTARFYGITAKFSNPNFRTIQKQIGLEMSDRLIHTVKSEPEKVNQVISEITNMNNFNSKQLWDTVLFQDYKDQQYQYDQMLLNPSEIEEGIYQCKCGSLKTFHKALQTRSGDEGMTIFVSCQECGHKWKINN